MIFGLLSKKFIFFRRRLLLLHHFFFFFISQSHFCTHTHICALNYLRTFVWPPYLRILTMPENERERTIDDVSVKHRECLVFQKFVEKLRGKETEKTFLIFVNDRGRAEKSQYNCSQEIVDVREREKSCRMNEMEEENFCLSNLNAEPHVYHTISNADFSLYALLLLWIKFEFIK